MNPLPMAAGPEVHGTVGAVQGFGTRVDAHVDAVAAFGRQGCLFNISIK